MIKEKVLIAVKNWIENEDWHVVGCEDQPEADAYIVAFEAAMGDLVAYSRGEQPKSNLTLALPFSSTTRGEKTSYRKVMKKYTRSTVFIDLNIHLLLVRDDASVLYISAEKVNQFLEDLNPYVARMKGGRGKANI